MFGDVPIDVFCRLGEDSASSQLLLSASSFY